MNALTITHDTLAPPTVGQSELSGRLEQHRASRVRLFRFGLASEWRKVRSVRSTAAVMTFVAVGAAVLVAAITASSPDSTPTIADGLGFPVVFSAVFAAVMGTLLFTSEEQHGTLDPTLIARPSRAAVAFTKTVVAAGFGASLTIVGQASGLVGGAAVGTALGDVSHVATGIAGLSASGASPRSSVSAQAWSSAKAPPQCQVCSCGGWSSRTCSSPWPRRASPASCRSSPATPWSASTWSPLTPTSATSCSVAGRAGSSSPPTRCWPSPQARSYSVGAIAPDRPDLLDGGTGASRRAVLLCVKGQPIDR